MDDKTVAPFALPPSEQVFGQMPSDAPAAPEPRQKRRGRPPNAEKAPKAKRQSRRAASVKTPEGFTVEQVRILRCLSEDEFGVVTTIMDRVPATSWIAIGNTLMAIAKLNDE